MKFPRWRHPVVLPDRGMAPPSSNPNLRSSYERKRDHPWLFLIGVAWIGIWSFPAWVQADQNAPAGGPWRISDEARLTVGGRGADDHVFANVVDAARLTDGRIVVADAGALELTFFSNEGELIGSTGRQGQGPGEFTLMASADACAADSIFVHDPTRIGVSVFDASGDFVNVRRFAPSGESMGRVERFACNRSGVALLVVEDERPEDGGRSASRGRMVRRTSGRSRVRRSTSMGRVSSAGHSASGHRWSSAPS